MYTRLYTKRPNYQKQLKNTKNCNRTLHRAQSIHKVYQRQGANPTVQSNPIPKKVQKQIFDQLIHGFTIIKGSPISLPPNCPKQTQQSSLPSFLSLFTNKDPAPTQENTLNYGMQHPLNPKESENQMPQRLHLQTMKKNMINNFCFCFTHTTSVRNPPTPPYELIQCQNPAPSCIQSKKLILKDTHEFQIMQNGNTYALLNAKEE